MKAIEGKQYPRRLEGAEIVSWAASARWNIARCWELMGGEQKRPSRETGGRFAWSEPIKRAAKDNAEIAECFAAAEQLWWKMAATVDKLVWSVANRRQAAGRRKGLQIEDLVAAGRIGAYRAAQTWDETKGANYSTFATMGIKLLMGVEMRIAGGPIHIAAVPNQDSGLLAHVLSEFARLGRPVRLDDAARYLGWTLEYAQMLQAANSFVHLDAPVGGDTTMTFADLVGHDPTEAIERGIGGEQAHGLIRDWMRKAHLTLQQRTIVLRRAEGESLSEIAKDFDVSRERIRQIERQALERLREVAA